MTGQARWIVGVDVGGTFTDVFFLDPATGHYEIAKAPSVPSDQSQGFAAGIRKRLDDFADIATIVHGTTVATNALLERDGARTGIIATKGFRDTLEMRRRDRPKTWGLWGQFEPVVPRDMRLEVDERTLADGTVRTPVDLDAVRAAARTLQEKGVESVCIAFINSYANDANERAAAEAVRAIWPNDHVDASSQILPEIREFERISTATLNAYLRPKVGHYLERLEGLLRDGGFGGQVLIVQSNGGLMSLDYAKQVPVRTALSGPAAGVIAAEHIADAAGLPNIVTCDMGGTSFDVSLIADGSSGLAAQTEIDFGLVVRTPMIEITTIGAGGGSIASVDRGGLLQVGPESAGSDPGPACYGQGSTRPTVTDANVVLGRINADRPIGGGRDSLDVEAAKTAIMAEVGAPLGLDLMAAADAIVRVANANMAGAIRLVSIERGHDPRKFFAMPFGGGGALHSCALIEDVGLAGAIVPRFPGVNSALGCAMADMRHDFVQTVNGVLGETELDALNERMNSLAKNGRVMLEAARVEFDRTESFFALDMCYQGQTHTVEVPLQSLSSSGKVQLTETGIREAFETRYRQSYGRPLEGLAERMLNLRVSVIGRRPRFDLSLLAPTNTEGDFHTGERAVWIGDGWYETPIYERLTLPVGSVVSGPAILEQSDATIFIEPGMCGEVDGFGNLIIQSTRREDVA